MRTMRSLTLHAEGEAPGEELRLGDPALVPAALLEQVGHVAVLVDEGLVAGTELVEGPEGGRDAMQSVRNDPHPIQRHVPIMIGGSGRKVTLKLVAQYADMNNLGNPIEGLLDAEAAMVGHCETLGRDERTIERTVEIQRVVIRDSTDAAWAREREILAHNGGAQLDEVRPGSTEVDTSRAVVGTPDEVFAQLRPYVEVGYHHLICGFPPPYDGESMGRLATEVRPRLEALVAG